MKKLTEQEEKITTSIRNERLKKKERKLYGLFNWLNFNWLKWIEEYEKKIVVGLGSCLIVVFEKLIQ